MKNKNFILGLVTFQVLIFSFASYSQSRTWENSETLWTQTLKVNDREALAHNNLGVVLMDQQKYELALEHFKTAILNKENYPEVFQIYNNLARVNLNLKKYDEGINTYNQSIQIEPNYAPTWFDRGLSYTDMGKYPEAISDFTKVLSMQPSAEVYYSRGIAFKNSGRYDEAINDYNKAIELKPGYISAYLNLANAYYKKGNYNDAYLNYNKVLNLDPSNGQCYLNRAIAKYNQGKIEEALQDYSKAVQNHVENPAVLNAIQQALNKK